MIDTRQKLTETAEKLFADQGYGSVSLRQIIAEAGVNLAAVHYHFGSKEDLLDAVIAPKAHSVNEDRLSRLARLKPGPNGRLAMRDVLDAFLIPMAIAADHNPQFVRLMGRIYAEGLMMQVVNRHFHPIFEPFIAAIHNAAPHLSPDELGWRVHFMMGAVAHTMTNQPRHQFDPETGDYHTRIALLIDFLLGGMLAPAGELVTAPVGASVYQEERQ